MDATHSNSGANAPQPQPPSWEQDTPIPEPNDGAAHALPPEDTDGQGQAGDSSGYLFQAQDSRLIAQTEPTPPDGTPLPPADTKEPVRPRLLAHLQALATQPQRLWQLAQESQALALLAVALLSLLLLSAYPRMLGWAQAVAQLRDSQPQLLLLPDVFGSVDLLWAKARYAPLPGPTPSILVYGEVRNLGSHSQGSLEITAEAYDKAGNVLSGQGLAGIIPKGAAWAQWDTPRAAQKLLAKQRPLAPHLAAGQRLGFAVLISPAPPLEQIARLEVRLSPPPALEVE